MERIILNEIKKEKNVISYVFEVSSNLEKYFSGKPFIVEYQEDIDSVPDSVAVIPFVCSVLPIIWLTNSELVIDEIDKDFYECIPEVRKGYEIMFPEAEFLGLISVGKIVENTVPKTENCALFFSGGLDAVSSLISHIDENPDLVAVWGSDIKYSNTEGWYVVYRGLADSARQFGLNLIVIKSSFREFDNEGLLGTEYYGKLKDGWWHGVKHGMGLIGHVAVLSYLKKYSKIYFASTYCEDDGLVRSASSPLTDNKINFVKSKVIHDGFELCRQEKARNVVNYHISKEIEIPLRVCWNSNAGDNCCGCEKCFRTILELITECAEPSNFGFEHLDEFMPNFRKISVQKNFFYDAVARGFWLKIQEQLRINKKTIKKTKYWRYIKWLIKADISNPQTIKLPLNLRIQNFVYSLKIYIWLHNVKTKLIEHFR